jgi:hypothetical protein
MTMQTQLAIDFTAPYQRHSATSKAAARGLTPSKVDQDRQSILFALQLYPDGLTDDGLQQITHLPGDSERPRRISLQKDGLIRDSGRKERTRSGKSAVVWVVA